MYRSNDIQQIIHKQTSYFTFGISVLTILFSASAIIGWVYEYEPFIRYQKNTVAMVMNTAISFCFLNIAVILYLKGFVQKAKYFTAFIFILSLLVLMQFLFNVDLKVDNLFIQHYDSLLNAFPGRMAPNTCVSFIMSAVVIFFVSICDKYNNFLKAAFAISIMLFGMSVVFISGYVSAAHDSYLWGTLIPMALNTSIGFFLTSISLLGLVYFEANKRDNVSFQSIIPYIASITIFIITLLLADSIFREHEKTNISNETIILILTVGTSISLMSAIIIRLYLSTVANEEKARETIELIHSTIESNEDGIVVVSLKNKVKHFNQAVLNILDLGNENIKNISYKRFIEIIAERAKDKKDYLHNISEANLSEINTNRETISLKNGKTIELVLHALMIHSKPKGIVVTIRDISESTEIHNNLLHQSTHDVLTGLYNKPYLVDMIKQNLENPEYVNSMFAIVKLDIDKFSKINEIFGYSRGDILLKMFADMLVEIIGEQYTVGRVAANEFMIFMNNIKSKDDVSNAVNKIQEKLRVPFKISGNNIYISCSIGIVFYPKDGIAVDELLTNAFLALKQAKQDGKNFSVYFDESLKKHSYNHIEMEHKIISAISNDQFSIYYQPIVDCFTNKVIAVEALIRWVQPDNTFVSPDTFIPVAEETGLINKIGSYVFSVAINDLKKFKELGFDDLKVCINVASNQIVQNTLDHDIESFKDDRNVNWHNVEFELTERSIISGTKKLKSTLNDYIKLGISLSIDDFGTGYSSLTYLQEYPISKVKIDKKFITDIDKNEKNRTLVKAIIALSEGLGLNIVAEGVETKAELDVLKELKCTNIQGYYFSKPKPFDECVEYIKNANNKD